MAYYVEMMTAISKITSRATWVFAVSIACVALAPVPAASQDTGGARTLEATGPVATPIDPETAPRPAARVALIDVPITIDGVIDEAVWAQAEVMTGFVQAMPATGVLASEQTVVRVLYDATTLYISAVCLDSEMDHLTVNSVVQDYETHDSDVFGIAIDPYLDRRNAYIFMINPAGAIKDVQVFDDSRNANVPWEGVIDVRTSTTDSAWTVEVAIPFTTLRFAELPGEQSWGFQFSRRVRRMSEESYWSPLARRELLHKMSRAGTIEGFADLQPGRNLSIKPYASASNASGSLTDVGAGESGFDGGFDLKYGITPRMTADVTFRTDFSQVEVDQERVNLTRFSLFFPEKRDFFLENAGTFTLGDLSERNFRMGSSLRDFTLFHSRRIGLDPSGRPVPILGGGRVTGQAGAWNIGVMEMQTRSARGLPAENFAVARVRRQILGGSDVGAIFVNRQSTDGSGTFNRSYGADANFRLLGNMVVNTYVAGTDEDGAEDGDAWAARASVAWRDRLWDVSAFGKQVGAAFNPGLGFVRRQGIRQGYVTVGAHPEAPGVLEVNPYGELSYITDTEGSLLTRDAAAGFGVAFHDGSSLNLSYTDRFERLAEAFTVRSGAVVPAGDHDFSEARVTYQSNAGLPFSGNISLTEGGYFNGDRRSIGVGALWRVNRHWAFDLFADRNEITLPEASFTADVYGGRVTWGLNTSIITSAYIQFNAETDELFSNLRVNVIHAPLSDVFLVYTERRSASSGDIIDRLLSFKVTKLMAF